MRPTSVKILRKQSFLTEGVKVRIVCEVSFLLRDRIIVMLMMLERFTLDEGDNDSRDYNGDHDNDDGEENRKGSD